MAKRVERTHNGGRWTAARKRSFITSALRSASVRWGPKEDALREAFVRRGVNPKTGRMCKLHRCAACEELFPKGQLRADHIAPVVDPVAGFVSWDEFIARLFVEKEGFMALCEGCHKIKTDRENATRKEVRALARSKPRPKPRRRKPPETKG